MSKPTKMPVVQCHLTEGRILVISEGHWASAPTLTEALAAYRRSRGRKVALDSWSIYSVHHATVVDEYGILRYPVDSPPIMLCSSLP